MGLNRSSDRFYLDAYTGQGGFLDGSYLIRHPRETDAKFEERQALAIYPNYVGKAVNIYSGFLYQVQPNRETSEQYARFAQDADGGRRSIDMLMLSYQRLAMLLGTVYIIVDKPKVQARTRADERLPYLALRLPGALAASKTDAAGNFERATFAETVDGETRYRTFTREGWTLSEDQEGREIIEQGSYTLGRVPVVKLHSCLPMDPTDVRAPAWAHDIAQLNWDLYNQVSEMRELFRKQVFSVLTLPVADSNEAQRLTDLKVSTENAITYDPTGGGKPAYIAPPAEPVELYMKNIAATVERIYELANLEFVGGVQQSGVALAFQFQQANRSLLAMAMLAEQAEIEIADLVSRWQGQDFNGVIAYPRDFNLADLGEELKNAMEATSLGISKTFDQEVRKRVARRYLGHNVKAATMEEIDREIESGGDPYGDRIAKEAAGA